MLCVMLYVGATPGWIWQILRLKQFLPKRGWRRKKGPSPHPILLAPHLCVVFIEHDDNLGHVVELWDGAKVSQSSLPLCILGFLPNTRRSKAMLAKGVWGWADGQEDQRKLAGKKKSLRRRVRECWKRMFIGWRKKKDPYIKKSPVTEDVE